MPTHLTEEELFDMTDEELDALNASTLDQPAEEPEAAPSEEDTPNEEPAQDEPETETEPTKEEDAPEPDKSVDPVAEDNEPSIEELKEFYKKITSPFKAGGKELSIRNADEAIRLAQQGVGYTQRMQELAPHRKIIMMLEKQGLLNDPSQLSFLLDIHNRDQEAIKKLLVDSKIDPMDIDTSVAPAYQAGNHQISDSDFAFRTQVEDIMATENGKETLEVLGKWDQASQEALYKNPSDIRVIHEHIQSGLYRQIDAEISRYKSLGAIPLTMPYVQAYAVVGQEMQRMQGEQQQQAASVPVQQAPTQVPPALEPVAVRPAPVAQASSNNAVHAAAAPRQAITSPKGELTVDDIMSMSDAELAKLTLK